MKDVEFANALAKGLLRFAKFVEAKKVDLSGIKPGDLKRQIDKILKSNF